MRLLHISDWHLGVTHGRLFEHPITKRSWTKN